eukprot:IDg11715t1
MRTNHEIPEYETRQNDNMDMIADFGEDPMNRGGNEDEGTEARSVVSVTVWVPTRNRLEGNLEVGSADGAGSSTVDKTSTLRTKESVGTPCIVVQSTTAMLSSETASWIPES